MYLFFIKLLVILLIWKNAVVSEEKNKKGATFVPEKKDFQINYKPKRIHINVTHSTVAEEWMIDRMTEIQNKLVTVRKLFQKKMKMVAWLVAHNIELTQPDYYHCTIGVYNNLIRRDYFKYPQGLLSEMRIIKEAVFKSIVEKIPIMEVNRRSAKRLNFFLNDSGEELKIHGKLVWSLSETIVRYQEKELMRTCLIPPGPRVPDENTTNLDYLATEDYEPMQYLGF